MMDSGLTALKGSADEVVARIRRPIICGGRTYAERQFLFSKLDEIDRANGPFDTIIQGGAKGADSLAYEWAVARSRCCAHVMPDWKAHGRKAGPMRNQLMIDAYKPDACIAFPGGTGTADMVKRAHAAGLTVIVVQGP